MARKTTHAPPQSRTETREISRRLKATSRNGPQLARKRTTTDGLAKVRTPQSCEEFVASQLFNIPAIDAVFIYADEDGLVHVYSVVLDYSFDLYKRLLNRERRIEKELPDVRFEFHVRAHQGRKANRAVPLGARAVFVR